MELCFPMINLASQIQSLETGRGLRVEMNVRAIMEAKSTSGACLAVGSNGQRKVRNRMPRFRGWSHWDGKVANKNKEQRGRVDLGEGEKGSVGR